MTRPAPDSDEFVVDIAFSAHFRCGLLWSCRAWIANWLIFEGGCLLHGWWFRAEGDRLYDLHLFRHESLDRVWRSPTASSYAKLDSAFALRIHDHHDGHIGAALGRIIR